MQAAFTRKYSEDSSGGRLQFTFYCDICRKEYAVPAVEVPNERSLFQKRKYQKVHDAAFEKAEEEAKGHFNCCPVCSRWVCDECFRIFPSGDICKECTENPAQER